MNYSTGILHDGTMERNFVRMESARGGEKTGVKVCLRSEEYQHNIGSRETVSVGSI